MKEDIKVEVYPGITMTITEIVRKSGRTRHCIQQRLKKGMLGDALLSAASLNTNRTRASVGLSTRPRKNDPKPEPTRKYRKRSFGVTMEYEKVRCPGCEKLFMQDRSHLVYCPHCLIW